jgi:hypothetical protein
MLGRGALGGRFLSPLRAVLRRLFEAELQSLRHERDELLRQRDIALGERNEFLRQRDVALEERDYAHWQLASYPRHPTTEDNRCLSIARDNMASALADAADDLPDAGPRWGTIAAHCRSRISKFRTALEVVHYAQCPVGHGSFGNICEIGGGYGAPARLWMTNSYKRPRLYAIVDLPESLFFAEVYLRATYGFDRVHYVQPHEEIGSVPDGTILLCPVSRREALKSITFNVILNTLSMQEMTDDYVAFYRDWLVTQPSNYFYSFNYFLQPADSRGESPNLFAPRLSEHWTILWTSGTSDGSPIAFTNVLAQRAEPGTIMPRNAATIEQYFRHPLTAAAAFPLMHAADTGADSRFAYQLMMAINEDFRHCPKELAFLAGRIHQLELQQGQLSESELACAKRILEDVTSKYSSKVTPAVPKHMRALQRDLYNSGAPQ